MSEEIEVHETITGIRDGTFPTEVHLENVEEDQFHDLNWENMQKDSYVDISLPPNVNYVALRESLLSEAPFVTKSNKTFWRKKVDEPFFQKLLGASFRHIASAISDTGSLNIAKLMRMKSSAFTKFMAVSMSEMIFSMKLSERDAFFSKLPEVTIFMIIETLHISNSKFNRLYNSVRFREILLDWCTELLGGIRLSNSKRGREWLFASSQDYGVLITGMEELHQEEVERKALRRSTSVESLRKTKSSSLLPPIHKVQSNNDFPLSNSHSMGNLSNTGGEVNPSNAVATVSTSASSNKSSGHAVSLYSIEHSPLVRLYIGMDFDKQPLTAGFGFKVALSHTSDRPLTMMNHYSLIRKGKVLPHKCDMTTVKPTLKSAVANQKNIMKQFQMGKAQAEVDFRKARDNYQAQLSLLSNKKLTQRELYAMTRSSNAAEA